MKKQLTEEYLDFLAKSALFTTYHYKIVLMLISKPYTQVQIANELGIKKQNVNRYVKELMKHGFIKEHHKDGTNKYLIANTTVSAIKKSTVTEEEALAGQLTFTDTE